MKRVLSWPALGIGLVLLIAGGCREELDLHTPQGALAALIESYQDGDGPRLYSLLSQESKRQIGEAWEGLRELPRLVATTLPLDAREQATTDGALGLLKQATSELQFFVALSRLDELKSQSGVVFGSTVQSAEVDDDKGAARLSTLTGQTFELVRESDGIWRSRHLEPVLERRLRILRANLATVRAYGEAVKARDLEVERLLGRLPEGAPGPAAGGAAAPDSATAGTGSPPAAGVDPAAAGTAPQAGSAATGSPPRPKAKGGKRGKKRAPQP